MVQFQFLKNQRFFDGCGPLPDAGEVCVRQAGGSRLALALRAMERGIEGFPHGVGEIRIISLPATPSLDDLLAAEFLKRQLEGQSLPSGCRAFAEYSALVREGLRSAQVPLQESIEAVYQAVLNSAPPAEVSDMTNSRVAEHGLAGWRRLADRIFAAAAEGLNPCEQPICSRAMFPREFAFLDRDRDVYQHDVERGERWIVKLPGGPPRASGLLLRNPKSLLFKHWCRVDPAAPTGVGYLLLVVWNDDRGWIVSTDAVHRLSLKPLRDKLQQAETDSARREPRPPGLEAVSGQSSTTDSWSDGVAFQHTLIGSPRGGTKLSVKDVLRIVRQWSQAESVASVGFRSRTPHSQVRRAASWLFGLVALVGVVAGIAKFSGAKFPDPLRETPRGADVENTFQDSPAISLGEQDWLLKPGDNSQEFVIDGLWEQDDRPYRLSGQLQIPEPHPANMRLTDAKLRLVNAAGAASDVSLEMSKGGIQFASVPLTLSKKNNRVRLDVKSEHDQPLPAKLHLEWKLDLQHRPKLYFLSVGVSDFQKYDKRLEFADDDAREISRTLQEQPLIFHKVIGRRLLDHEATRGQILRELAKLRERHQKREINAWDLVLITLSGHGVCDPEYCFLPYDYDPEMKEDRRVSASDMLVQLKELPCQIVLFVDTCHAGAFRSKGARGEGTASPPPTKDEVEAAVQGAIAKSWTNEKGLVIFSACLPTQEAREDSDWKHGVFSLALIEFLRGRDYQNQPLPTGPQPVISAQDLRKYLEDRVAELAKARRLPQDVVVTSEKAVSLSLIPLAVRGGRGN